MSDIIPVTNTRTVESERNVSALGEVIALSTWERDAFFVWRKFIDDCIDERTGERQAGVNNAIFANHSRYLSSELIRQACAIADIAWPNQRRYTYVNAEKVKSTNPGFCYLKAGWKRCGRTRSGLIVMEFIPGTQEPRLPTATTKEDA